MTVTTPRRKSSRLGDGGKKEEGATPLDDSAGAAATENCGGAGLCVLEGLDGAPVRACSRSAPRRAKRGGLRPLGRDHAAALGAGWLSLGPRAIAAHAAALR